VYTAGITPETTLVFKALVVIAVCLLQAPKFRALMSRRRSRPASPTPTADTSDLTGAQPLSIPDPSSNPAPPASAMATK
jgi:galactofuranose transport system permease protein